MSTCGKCQQSVNRSSTASNLLCKDCNCLFHPACVNMQETDVSFFKNKSWNCPDCISAQRSLRVNDSTPVKINKQCAGESEVTAPSKQIKSMELYEGQLECLKNELLNSIEELKSIVNTGQEKRDKLEDIIAKQSGIVERQQTLIESLRSDVNGVQERLRVTEERLDDLEMYTRRNTLEIHGLPEPANENVLDTFARVSKAVGMPPVIVDAIHRLRPFKGLLSMLGWESDRRPSPPLNLVADFAGGSVLCALGIMMALAERTRSGQGQVVDCSMVAGSAYLASWIFRGHGSQLWSRPRAKNFLDGGAFFYDTYETKDGNWMAVGALEPQFYSQLINGLGLDEEQVPQICSAEDGVKFRKLFAQIFKSKTRAEWCEIFDGLDACVTPILSLEEAALNQHNIDNKTFSKNDDGAFSPNPAPILSRTPAETNFHKCNPGSGDDTEQILVNDLGYSKTDVERFEDLGAIMRNKL